VPAKKTRQPGKTGKAVYLLSADRKFRRLSLKKISERVKGARRRTRGRSIANAATLTIHQQCHTRMRNDGTTPTSFVNDSRDWTTVLTF